MDAATAARPAPSPPAGGSTRRRLRAVWATLMALLLGLLFTCPPPGWE